MTVLMGLPLPEGIVVWLMGVTTPGGATIVKGKNLLVRDRDAPQKTITSLIFYRKPTFECLKSSKISFHILKTFNAIILLYEICCTIYAYEKFSHDLSFHLEIDPPIGTEHCDWLYGIFGHETSCTRYWTCWNGTATEQLCIGGLLYNEDTHACDWPENVPGCQKHRNNINNFL